MFIHSIHEQYSILYNSALSLAFAPAADFIKKLLVSLSFEWLVTV